VSNIMYWSGFSAWNKAIVFSASSLLTGEPTGATIAPNASSALVSIAPPPYTPSGCECTTSWPGRVPYRQNIRAAPSCSTSRSRRDHRIIVGVPVVPVVVPRRTAPSRRWYVPNGGFAP
jgi:hypothetical protein